MAHSLFSSHQTLSIPVASVTQAMARDLQEFTVTSFSGIWTQKVLAQAKLPRPCLLAVCGA